ncbi:MAG TPA: hypothetical protein VGZ71_10645, partial [Puia sp.]|nr:hypothetical protein [Puia sp.]
MPVFDAAADFFIQKNPYHRTKISHGSLPGQFVSKSRLGNIIDNLTFASIFKNMKEKDKKYSQEQAASLADEVGIDRELDM